MTIELVHPDPVIWAPMVLEWLHEHPKCNFDDYGPRTVDEIEAKLANVTIRTWGVIHDGAPCGVIAYQSIAPEFGAFAGICFTESVHGKGIARLAVQRVLNRLWAEGVEKISASYFADNLRVARFLAKLGAVREGLLRAQTRRNGEPVDMELVALFAPQRGH